MRSIVLALAAFVLVACGCIVGARVARIGDSSGPATDHAAATVPGDGERDACEIAPVVCSPIVTVTSLTIALVGVMLLPVTGGPLLVRQPDPYAWFAPFVTPIQPRPPRHAAAA